MTPPGGRGSAAWFFIATLGLLIPERVQAARCGTPSLFENGIGPKALHRSGVRERAAAETPRARTLVSDHFLIHYSLRGLHKARTGPEDKALTKSSDSLFAVFAGLTDAKRDSSVYAGLDRAGLPPPAYIAKMRDDFEEAWAYFVDELGMPAPHSNVRSVQYSAPASLPGKFPVDVVDVGTADSAFAGETYGVTYPPNALSITIENDFLHSTALVGGKITGKPIRSILDGRVVHDYAAEWGLGIAVTVFHEFYHAIQFTYIPEVRRFHAWYELSAVGMEERKAGEADDYLQYLPCVLKNHATVPLNSLSRGPCTHAPMYGHGIFHQYLGKTLDPAFDVRIWERLSLNGDVLEDGLETAFARYGKSMAEIYPDYAAALFFSGPSFHSPDGAFSPDMDRWPRASFDSLDLGGAAPVLINALPPLSFAIWKVKWGPTAQAVALETRNVTGITRIHANADTSVMERLEGGRIMLSRPLEGFQEYFLVLPNASFLESASAEVKDNGLTAFPNPAAIASARVRFSKARNMAFPARIRIYGEDGRPVRELNFENAEADLIWDLRNDRNRTVTPGLYYYRLENEGLKILMVSR